MLYNKSIASFMLDSIHFSDWFSKTGNSLMLNRHDFARKLKLPPSLPCEMCRKEFFTVEKVVLIIVIMKHVYHLKLIKSGCLNLHTRKCGKSFYYIMWPMKYQLSFCGKTWYVSSHVNISVTCYLHRWKGNCCYGYTTFISKLDLTWSLEETGETRFVILCWKTFHWLLCPVVKYFSMFEEKVFFPR